MSTASILRRPYSTQTYLALLVLVVLVPVLLFAGVLLLRYYDSERDAIERGLREDARQLAVTVDRDLASMITTLQTLATSNFLQTGDYAQFHRRLLEVRPHVGVHILVRDLTGQQLANTRLPYGEKLPLEPLEGDSDVIATKRPYISDVLVGAVVRQPVLTITVPALQTDGRVAHLLNLSIPTERMTRLLTASIDSDQRAGIVDRKGIFIARTVDPDRYVGTPASPAFAAASGKEDGVFTDIDVENRPVIRAFARSRLAGWVVWTSTPQEALDSILRRTLWALLAFGVALTAIGLACAYLISRRISSAIYRLHDAGRAFENEQPASPVNTSLREVNEVGRTLELGSRLLTQRLRERDQAQAELHALNIDLEGRVAQRTAELKQSNTRMLNEMAQREEAERRVRQMQKMEAVGQLTGGIAHDFNNMMAVIISGLNLLQRRLARGETDVQRFVDGAMDGAQRAAALTQRLLAFARRQPLSPVPLDANRLVAGMSDLLRRSIVETIHIETVLAGGLWPSHADPNQLENAILNLAINGRDAMPNGGRLTIETSNAHLDDAYAAEHSEVAAGQYVMIAITDTGTGMTPQVAERAFEPFFTTKSAGQGTGLGLSQVYGFIKQSKGHVKIYSEAGRGTTVKLYLPRFFEAGDVPRARAGSIDPPPRGTQETILVVEDEDQVRAFLIESLRELGYRALSAENALQGLRLLDANPDISLLFTDVVMPEMDGRRLADEARKRRPALKILFTTGYTRNAIVHNGVLDSGVDLISKPFTIDQLAAKLRDVLGPAKSV